MTSLFEVIIDTVLKIPGSAVILSTRLWVAVIYGLFFFDNFVLSIDLWLFRLLLALLNTRNR